MFRNRRRLHRLAVLVLLAWLFGVAAGVVNACALHVADHSHEAALGATADHHADAAHNHGNALEDDEEGGPANCLDFCEKSTVSVPAPKFKIDFDSGVDHPTFVASLPALTVRDLGGLSGSSESPGGLINRRAGPPPRIAFMRLAL